MQRFEITVDGVAEKNDHATQAEAEAAAQRARANADGKAVLVRQKAAPSTAPPAQPEPQVHRGEQGTPGNPAGSDQR